MLMRGMLISFSDPNLGLVPTLVPFQYNPAEVGAAKPLLHEFLAPELKTVHARQRKFRANRSMRDVEPSVNLWLRTMDNVEIEPEEPA